MSVSERDLRMQEMEKGNGNGRFADTLKKFKSLTGRKNGTPPEQSEKEKNPKGESTLPDLEEDPRVKYLEEEEPYFGGATSISRKFELINLDIAELNQNITKLNNAQTRTMKVLDSIVKWKADVDKKVAGYDKALADLGKKKAELDKVSADVDKKQAELDKKAADVDKKLAELDKKSADVDKKQAEFDKKQADLDKKQAELDKKSADTDKKLAEIGKKNTELGKKLTELDKKLAEIDKILTEVDKRSTEVDSNFRAFQRSYGDDINGISNTFETIFSMFPKEEEE